MSWLTAIETTVTGLGYDLVETERAPRGLLRIYIDRLPGHTYDAPGEFITVEDCEKVTRQLQRVLEVENAEYARLEVSSPGLDRLLKNERDYARFVGETVAITLKLPFEGRKKFEGVLMARPAEAVADVSSGWRLVLTDAKAKGAKPAAKDGKVAAKGGKPAAVEQALDFELGEVREARLVPVVDFKGRRVAPPPTPSADEPAVERVDGGREE